MDQLGKRQVLELAKTKVTIQEKCLETAWKARKMTHNAMSNAHT